MNRLSVAGIAMLLATSAALGEDVNQASTTLVNVVVVESAADLAPVDGIRSAGQPDEEALKLAAEAGYKAVIDMRGENEMRGMDEPAAVEDLGMQYISMPIVGAGDISFANAGKLDGLLEEIDGPVLIHCGSGNRVGALLALRKRLRGASAEAALAHGRDAGLTGLEPVVVEVLKERDQQ